MARLRILLFASVLCSLAMYGQGDVTSPKTVIIPVPKSSPAVDGGSTVPSNDAQSVPDKTTTTPPDTTTSTTEKTTTSTTKTTTTPAPTPTPTPTPPPTPAPPTPAPPTPAPTPAPGPVPPPERGFWNYTEGNVTCILIQFAAQFNVTYTKDVNNSTLGYVLLNVPKNATVLDGSCNATAGQQWLQLGWPLENNTLRLLFTRNDSTKMYALSSFNVKLAPELFVNSSIKEPVELWHGAEWWTPLATSYRCAAATRLAMYADRNTVATLELTQLQEEAFRNSHTQQFSSARDCGGGDVPDAVPIAVGCALGGLVVVVLAAYLLARRRSAARGYLSM